MNSLLMLERKPDMIVVYDDASTDPLVRVIAKDLARVCENLHFVENPSNRGIKNSMKRGCELLFSKGCDMVVNLDGDAIVKKGHTGEAVRFIGWWCNRVLVVG